jgi:CRP/FNR family nitrogen fixation transcriptional regulator
MIIQPGEHAMPFTQSVHANPGFRLPPALAFGPITAPPRAAPAAPTLHFAPDGEIYAEGGPASRVYRLVRGTVRTCRFLCDGRRQIDAFHGEGDVFGFETGTTHRLAAEAVTHCTVIAYQHASLRGLVANDDTGLSSDMLSYVMRCLERAQDHALLLGRGSAAQKVACFLLEMLGHGAADGTAELPMTRQDIADYLGLTIETVSRTLSQFERDGLIALPTARRVCLKNRKTLQSYAA